MNIINRVVKLTGSIIVSLLMLSTSKSWELHGDAENSLSFYYVPIFSQVYNKK